MQNFTLMHGKRSGMMVNRQPDKNTVYIQILSKHYNNSLFTF